jgi:5'-methylthioadenosine phosphorylase
MRQALIESTKKRFDGRVFIRGTYAVTDGRHFESPAEVAMMNGQADIVGQSIAPEVYLAREIGACYAGTVLYGELWGRYQGEVVAPGYGGYLL